MNKTKIIPSINYIISTLNKYGIDFVLIGSEVGKIYNLCESNKDIDLLVNPSSENLKKLYNYITQFFIIELNSFLTLDRLILKTSDIKGIEIFIRYAACISYPINSFIETNFYDNKVKILTEKDYISCVEQCIIYCSKNNNIDAVKKYKKIIENYKLKY